MVCTSLHLRLLNTSGGEYTQFLSIGWGELGPYSPAFSPYLTKPGSQGSSGSSALPPGNPWPR